MPFEACYFLMVAILRVYEGSNLLCVEIYYLQLVRAEYISNHIYLSLVPIQLDRVCFTCDLKLDITLLRVPHN